MQARLTQAQDSYATLEALKAALSSQLHTKEKQQRKRLQAEQNEFYGLMNTKIFSDFKQLL